LQTLQLTELQASTLENITDEKIETASLLELVKAFAILKKQELGMEGGKVKVSGLVEMLMEMEAREAKQKA
jgi:hypothetical protein